MARSAAPGPRGRRRPLLLLLRVRELALQHIELGREVRHVAMQREAPRGHGEVGFGASQLRCGLRHQRALRAQRVEVLLHRLVRALALGTRLPRTGARHLGRFTGLPARGPVAPRLRPRLDGGSLGLTLGAQLVLGSRLLAASAARSCRVVTSRSALCACASASARTPSCSAARRAASNAG
ncbi:MAG: hypothetical protein IPG17_29975, partial [Sandaracinaceae bacterium]|nr:hypothetical protein [Sandaracinaceae bacterium]